MMPKKIQAKHIDEAPILKVLSGTRYMTHWDMPNSDPSWSLCAAIPSLRAFPEKVLRAKLAAMKRRGLIDGCECGCRGDWRLNDGMAA